MFVELKPLLAEGRAVHIVVQPAAADGQIILYVEPAQKEKESQSAFCTPFRVVETAEVLDAQLGATLAQWVGTRAQCVSGLAAALEEAERVAKAATEEAAKKAAERKNAGKSATAVKPTKQTAKAVVAPAPDLLNDLDVDDESGVEDETASSAEALVEAASNVGPTAIDGPAGGLAAPAAQAPEAQSTAAAVVVAPVELELF